MSEEIFKGYGAMNVSRLSDVELNTAMHRLYWVSGGESDYDKFYDSIPASRFNYLTDWNLTMPLAAEYFDEIQKIKGISNFLNDNKKPALRAICEVLVTLAMEHKS